MTLNRYLLLFTTLISTILAFLSFSPPQTGKWVYMWQAYVWPAKEITDALHSYVILETPPKGYIGIWRTWNHNGNLESILKVDKKGEVTKIYGSLSVDRRAEFGIEVE